jgi:hypothetical protein
MLLHKAESLTKAILQKIGHTGKPAQKFFTHILILFMGLRGKYNFTNFSRYGLYNEKTYRNQMGKPFDWAAFNTELSFDHCQGERILAYDPCYLPKSGKHTNDVGWFWSGTANAVKRGIEIGAVAVIDIGNASAFSLYAEQTPVLPKGSANEGNTIDHHVRVVTDCAGHAHRLGISYIAVDGYFAKHKFVEQLCSGSHLQVISKLRSDANMQYIYNGPRTNGKGRPRVYDGKVDNTHIDRRRIKFCCKLDRYTDIYSGIVYSVSLKRKIRLVYLEQYDTKGQVTGYALLFSTDLNLEPEKVVTYYKMRFHIEFLFRDAKSHVGLEHCQARSRAKINYHINACLTTVSLAKVLHWLNVPANEREGFSMLDIKTMY